MPFLRTGALNLSQAVNWQCPLNRGLQLWLRTDNFTSGTWVDLVGRHNGAPTASLILSGRKLTSRSRGALTGAAFILANPANLITGLATTASFWFMRTTTADHTPFLVNTFGGAVPALRIKAEGTGGSGIDRFQVHVETGGGTNSNGDGGASAYSSQVPVHCTATVDTVLNEIRIYVNGVLSGTPGTLNAIYDGTVNAITLGDASSYMNDVRLQIGYYADAQTALAIYTQAVLDWPQGLNYRSARSQFKVAQAAAAGGTPMTPYYYHQHIARAV